MRRRYVAAVFSLIAICAIWGWRVSQSPPLPLVHSLLSVTRQAGNSLPALNVFVNDFAKIIDHDSTIALDATIRSLQRETGDVIIVATLPDCGSQESIKTCSTELFENHGRGIGGRGKDNGVLVLLVMNSRQVRITLGSGIEHLLSEQDATSIVDTMTPLFRVGQYGEGFRTGVQGIASRIRMARGLR